MIEALKFWWKTRHCPHARIRGVYGDEIIFRAHGLRLKCLDCLRYLDGPLELATHKRDPHVLFGSYVPRETR